MRSTTTTTPTLLRKISMKIKTIEENLRKLGYQLAVREIYGENTPEYFRLKRDHDSLLHKLYKLQHKV